jgi:hypothetical protein
MTAQNIRSVVGRFVVIGGLAIALTAGSIAVHHPSEAGAAPKSCMQAIMLGDLWTNYGNLMLANGRPIEAVAGFARADGFYDGCDTWA